MRISKKTCKFYTFGCKVNQYETQLIRERFQNYGFRETQNNPAFYVINGCTLTAAADRKCRQLVRLLHRKSPKAQIIITGCSAKNYCDADFYPEGISHVVPQEKKEFIPEIIFKKNRSVQTQETPDPPDLKKQRLLMQISDFAGHSRAFIKVQDGCSNSCTYCIVPQIRGKPVSKDVSTVAGEISNLNRKGFKEIVLAGIDLGAWGIDFTPRSDLACLIEQLERRCDIKRLRLSSIELKYINQALIERFLKSKKLCRHLHVPLQSGDDFILKRMKRSYTSYEYLKKMKKIKKLIKGISLTTDIMVGFPGEKDRHFKNTLKIARELGFSRIHIFSFSPRAKTKAAGFSGRPSKEIVGERKRQLEILSVNTSFAFRKQLLKKRVEVLFERKEDGHWSGYSDTYVKVKTRSGRDCKNKLIPVKIIDVTLSSTIGKI